MSNELGVAIAQLNLIVGDLSGNVSRITKAAEYAFQDLGCRYIVYPELSICGYPPEDLLLRDDFLQDTYAALKEIVQLSTQAELAEIALVLGYPWREQQALYNAASIILNGEILGTYRKHHLPNYGVFDEHRYFSQGTESCVVTLDKLPVGLTICEDVWWDGPVEWAVEQGAKLIFNLNGSPFNTNKPSYRETEVVGKRALQNHVPIVYANLVGGQDELVFDGGSFACNAKGEVTFRLPKFEESVERVSFDVADTVEPLTAAKPKSTKLYLRSYAEIHQNDTTIKQKVDPGRFERLDDIYRAIKLGVSDYVRKNGFKGAVVGVSGGIDSALTLAIVADALGPENVQAISMPTRFTQKISIEDALSEAKTLGVASSVVPIDSIFESVLVALKEEFKGLDMDVTEENIQARCRGMILMAISNKKHKMVITTGNKSEVAVGYATLYGDMAGGFGAIKDVPKELVYELAEYRNVVIGPVIPARVMTRPPTAELRADQLDVDSLPPYHVLDKILKAYVEEEKSIQEVVDMGFESKTVERIARLVQTNEYKRKQAAPGVRISLKAFGRDRRYPITNHY